MPIEFPCQNCGAKIIIRHLSPGEIAQCKNCGAKNTIPEKSVETDAVLTGAPQPAKAAVTEDKTEDFTKLNSEKTAPALLILLSLLIVIEFVITIIMYDLHDYLGNPFQSGEYLFFIWLGIILLVTGIVTIIVFSVWIYRAHEELAVYYPGYPVKPVQSVVRLLIPFYSIWGFWNVFMNIIRRFRKDDDRMREIAQKLYVPFIVSFIMNIVGYMSLLKYLLPSDKISYEGLFTREDILYNAFAILQCVLYIAIFVLIRKALKYKFSAYAGMKDINNAGIT